VSSIRETNCIRALQSGDEAALEALIRQYTSYVGAIVWNIIGGALTADDLEETVSDVFLTLWNNADKLQPGKLRPYLASIARSRAKNKLRTSKHTLCLDDDLLLLSPDDPERELDDKELRVAVQKAVSALPARERALFLRHYYYGQTAREIAEETGVKLFTVQTRLRRARERFKNNLIEGGYFRDDKDQRLA
jgi:RNA polymerase sigma-70 factor (ECF subfamily)